MKIKKYRFMVLCFCLLAFGLFSCGEAEQADESHTGKENEVSAGAAADNFSVDNDETDSETEESNGLPGEGDQPSEDGSSSSSYEELISEMTSESDNPEDSSFKINDPATGSPSSSDPESNIDNSGEHEDASDKSYFTVSEDTETKYGPIH